jgi:hypothetical protein
MPANCDDQRENEELRRHAREGVAEINEAKFFLESRLWTPVATVQEEHPELDWNSEDSELLFAIHQFAMVCHRFARDAAELGRKYAALGIKCRDLEQAKVDSAHTIKLLVEGGRKGAFSSPADQPRQSTPLSHTSASPARGEKSPVSETSPTSSFSQAQLKDLLSERISLIQQNAALEAVHTQTTAQLQELNSALQRVEEQKEEAIQLLQRYQSALEVSNASVAAEGEAISMKFKEVLEDRVRV